jgi:ABC-type enterochelin transport system substrate-binding protein
VSAILEYRTRASAPLAASALAAVLLLGACSNRDTKLSESMAAAEQSALRAEKAALRAEEAANKAGATPAPVVVEDDEEEPADEADKALADANEPPANEPEGAN